MSDFLSFFPSNKKFRFFPNFVQWTWSKFSSIFISIKTFTLQRKLRNHGPTNSQGFRTIPGVWYSKDSMILSGIPTGTIKNRIYATNNKGCSVVHSRADTGVVTGDTMELCSNAHPHISCQGNTLLGEQVRSSCSSVRLCCQPTVYKIWRGDNNYLLTYFPCW
jgi:hypothetical protein